VSEGLVITEGGLSVEELQAKWYKEFRLENYGAMVSFLGIVRDEDGIEGLSFEIYQPILSNWFEVWQKRVIEGGGYLLMAHSLGDVWLHESSFLACVCSRKRRFGLEFLDIFVEDFKKNAPIWKYDIKNKKRIYAKDRSHPLEGAGLLSL